MKYYKDNTGNVFAYDDEQLAQVARLTELELLIKDKEPEFNDASSKLQQASLEFNEANELLHSTRQRSETNDESISIEDNEEIQQLTLIVNDRQSKLDEVTVAFEQIESEYTPLKKEHDAILPIFYDIRENLNIFKKMTVKEVDAHLNPPIPKEQLIIEAEQQKQLLLAEANNAIAPLQYAENLGIATAEESALLVDWQKYSVYLNRIDVSLAPNIDWPQKP
ncbi:tail fiber assembly protein [Providencia rettgeri]